MALGIPVRQPECFALIRSSGEASQLSDNHPRHASAEYDVVKPQRRQIQQKVVEIQGDLRLVAEICP
jgi:hypothetical protein